MTATRAGGPPAYVAAHRIAVVDKRLPFDQAYCLAKLVFEHAGGPVAPDRQGPVSLKLCKALAAEDLVMLTADMAEATPATARLTVTAAMLDMLDHVPGPTVVVETSGSRRKKVDWRVEVTQDGLDLVPAAMEAG